MQATTSPAPLWVARAEDSARFDFAVGRGDSEVAHVAEREDAILFSAAPGMLAALTDLVQAIEHTPLGVRALTALTEARKAIAKANQA